MKDLEQERYGMTPQHARRLAAGTEPLRHHPAVRPLETMHPLAQLNANPHDVIQNRVMRAYHADRHASGARDPLALAMWESYNKTERLTSADRAVNLKRFLEGSMDDRAVTAWLEHMDRRQTVISESV